jgi:hypothetical protein
MLAKCFDLIVEAYDDDISPAPQLTFVPSTRLRQPKVGIEVIEVNDR